MKVNDLIQKCERDLTTAEITDMVAKDNRQVDLIFAEKRTDDSHGTPKTAPAGTACVSL